MTATESPFPGLLEELLSVNHGWWCDFIIDTTKKSGKIVSRLQSQQYIDPSLYRLYGYQDNASKFSFLGNVHPENQSKLIVAVKAAIRPNAPARSERVSIKTARGDYKLVQVYFRRIELCGKPILASLHSDLAVSDDLRWIDQTVLDMIPAYIFIKRWDVSKNKFIFRHVNERLAKALGAEKQDEVTGKSDEDFFDDPRQRNAFFEADKEVHDSNDSLVQVIREEAFAPKTALDDGTGSIRRIVTVKTPYWFPFDGVQRGERQVLGIAFDVTPVTRVLRALADNSNDAIFIKDSKNRYQLVNKVFMRMMGIEKESELLHRTFQEVFTTRPAKLMDGSDSADLIKEIEHEDKQVFDGKETSRVRVPISATTLDPWMTMKKMIGNGKDQQKYILGISKPLIRDSFVLQTPFLSSADRVPQAISVKLYCPGMPPEQQFQVVWGNRTFLGRHGKTDLQEIIGKTDYDLWDPKQAEGYQRKDRRALQVAQELQEECRRNDKRLEDCWEELKNRLELADCWEYRERQQRPDRQSILQTTKWAQFIGERWFVFVVYSDVTKAEDERRLYHRMTVHTIRNGLFPASLARDHLEKFLKSKAEPMVEEVLRYLLDTLENIETALKHHMELVHMDPNLKSLELGSLELVVRKLVEKEHRLAKAENGRVIFRTETNYDSRLRVKIDVMFISMIIAELLRNAQKSLIRARWHDKHCLDEAGKEALENQGWELAKNDYIPEIHIVFGSENEIFKLTVIDNGDACRGRKARQKLQTQFEKAQTGSFSGKEEHLGVAFCWLVIRKHGGQFNLESNSERTQFSITLPLSSRS